MRYRKINLRLDDYRKEEVRNPVVASTYIRCELICNLDDYGKEGGITLCSLDF
jgi:hypothetical protein